MDIVKRWLIATKLLLLQHGMAKRKHQQCLIILVKKTVVETVWETVLDTIDYERTKIKVPRPNEITLYNKLMGGVDKANLLLSLYHTR